MNTSIGPESQIKIDEFDSRDPNDVAIKAHIENKLTEAMNGVKNNDKDIASTLKHSLEETYGGTWHVIVGRNFAAYVTYETRHMIYFYRGQKGFLIFRTPS